MRKELTALALVLMTSAAYAQPAINGIGIGKPLEADTRLFYKCASTEDALLGTVCQSEMTISFGHITAKTFSVSFYDDKLVARVFATLAQDDFEDMRDALTLRYGKPAQTTESTLTNKVGAQFGQVVYIWLFPGSKLILSKYGSNLETSTLHVLGTKGAEEFKKRKDAMIARVAARL